MASRDNTMVSGRPNGASSGNAFDRWLRYPAGFSQQALQACFEALGQCSGGSLVDPFCGVATVGTSARLRGLGFLGIEAHPWIAQAAALKFKVPGRIEELKGVAQEIVADLVEADTTGEHELVVRSFDKQVLGLLVAMRERIGATESPWREHLQLALLSNLRSHAAVKVGWPYQLPGKPRTPQSRDPVGAFLRRASAMADDLQLWDDQAPDAAIVCGDSRTDSPWQLFADKPLVGSISSPPYLNNFDYADATRLELYFSGMVSTWSEMCRDIRSEMVIATTQQSSVRGSEEASEALRRWPGVFAHVMRILQLLERERLRRSRGKEYSRVIAPYFLGVGNVLERLAERLPEGAPVALVVGDSAPYGVHIDTPGILAALGAEVGLLPEKTEPLRSRGLRWRTNGNRHQVVLTEALVTFRVAS